MQGEHKANLFQKQKQIVAKRKYVTQVDECGKAKLHKSHK